MKTTDARSALAQARPNALTPLRRPRQVVAALIAAALIAAGAALFSPAASWAASAANGGEPTTTVSATATASTATASTATATSSTVTSSTVTSSAATSSTAPSSTVSSTSTLTESPAAGDTAQKTTTASSDTTGTSAGSSGSMDSTAATSTPSESVTTKAPESTVSGTGSTAASGSSSFAPKSPGSSSPADSTAVSSESSSLDTSGTSSVPNSSQTAPSAGSAGHATPLAAPSTGITVDYTSCVGSARTFTVRVSGGRPLSVSSTVDGGAARTWTYSPVMLAAATGQTVVFRDGFGTIVGTFQMPACVVDYAANLAENGSYVFDRVPNASTAAPAPSHGTVVALPDGTLRYTPITGYTGPDSFGYSSPTGGGTVAITVVPITGAETLTWSGCDTANITNHTSVAHSYTWNNGSMSTVVARLAPGQSAAVELAGDAGEFNNVTSDTGTELANWVPDTDECDTFTADTLTTSRDHPLTLDTFLGAFIRQSPEHGTATGEPTSNSVTYTPDHCYVGDDYFVYLEWKINVTHYVTVHVVGSPCATTSTGSGTTADSSTSSVTTASSSVTTASSSAPPSTPTTSLESTRQAASSSADLVPPPQPPASSGGLAFTGINIGPLLTVGGLLILAGLALLRIGRRRSGPFSTREGAHVTRRSN